MKTIDFEESSQRKEREASEDHDGISGKANIAAVLVRAVIKVKSTIINF